MAKKPALTIVRSGPTGHEPPVKLGKRGRALWDAVMTEYGIADSAGGELLCQAAGVCDLIEQLDAAIKRDGPVVYSNRGGPRPNPCVRDLIHARGLLMRLLTRLGVTDEVIKPGPGRPTADLGWAPDLE